MDWPLRHTFGHDMTTVRNWAGNIAFNPAKVEAPTTGQQLSDLLTQTIGKVRCIGSGHSWNAQMATDQLLFSTHQLNKVLAVSKEQKTVIVQAGIKLKDLNTALWEQGLALRNLGSISNQSLAGAIATGTHGTGIGHRILADQVRSFDLVKANGEQITIDRQADLELFNLAVVSLGMLGVVTAMTLDVVPRFHLHEQSGLMPFDQACDTVLDLLHQHDHVKMWWWPHTDQLMVYRYNRTEAPINDPRWRQWLMDEVLAEYFYRGLLKWGNQFPQHRPAINRGICSAFMGKVDRVERSYRVFNVPKPPVHRETEWAFDAQLAPTILPQYRDMVRLNGHRINFIQEIRFTKADPFALSPCHGRDSVWVGAYQADNRDWAPLLRDFEHLAQSHNGRPHWGKEFNLGPAQLQAMYPKWAEVWALQQKFDPDGRLLNPFLDRVKPA